MIAPKQKRWTRRVMETSDALTLEEGVFTKNDPRAIARSLKRSADRSRRRKAEPYRSALSMLTFHINRSGTNMPANRKRILNQAKDELRNLYGKDVKSKSKSRTKTTSKKSAGARKKKNAKRRAPPRQKQ